MSWHKTELEKKCKKCNTNLIRYSLKSPFLDDFLDGCPKCEPGEAEASLISWNRSAARAEEAMERDYNE